MTSDPHSALFCDVEPFFFVRSSLLSLESFLCSTQMFRTENLVPLAVV